MNNVDSHNETSFIDKFLNPIFGDCWASHVITQVSLNSLSNITKLKGQRVDFLLSQYNNHYIIELDGKEHCEHNEKDNQRKELERKEMVFLKKHSSDFRKNRCVAFGIPFKQRRRSHHG